MNKYKIVSLVLAIALLAAWVQLIAVKNHPAVNKQEVVLQNILNRKSVRSYTDQAVERGKLDTLVRMAMAAPSSKDMRPWQFYVIDDARLLSQLADTMPRAKMLREAKAAIVVCGDTTVVDDQGRSSRGWVNDCSAATENLLLAAEAMGLGAVWVAAWPYEERMQAVFTLLDMPEGFVPMAVIPIGYPKGNPQPKDKFNADLIHYNGW